PARDAVLRHRRTASRCRRVRCHIAPGRCFPSSGLPGPQVPLIVHLARSPPRMVSSSSIPISEISAMPLARPLVLATDLDGTFLGGDAAHCQALYQWLHDLRTRQPQWLTLIFVTG